MSDGCGRKIGPYDCCTIVTGDAKELAKAIPDESVDLLLADPPFNIGKDYGPLVDDQLPEAEYLVWYESWVREAYRIMQNGYAYAFCSPHQLWGLRPAWETVGFRWRMMCIWWGPNYAAPTQTIINEWGICYEPIMMFVKGKRRRMLNEVSGLNSDAIMRHTRPQRSYGGTLKRIHPTQKPVSLYSTIMGRTPSKVVTDLFVGSGASIMAAKMLGRHYLGFEIDPEVAERARERVRNTQPPLFVMQSEQSEMEV